MSRRNPARSLPMTAGGRPSEPGSAQVWHWSHAEEPVPARQPCRVREIDDEEGRRLTCRFPGNRCTEHADAPACEDGPDGGTGCAVQVPCHEASQEDCPDDQAPDDPHGVGWPILHWPAPRGWPRTHLVQEDPHGSASILRHTAAAALPPAICVTPKARRWRYAHGFIRRRMPCRGGVSHHPRRPFAAVLSLGARIGMPPVACGVGHPITYKHDITLIADSKGLTGRVRPGDRDHLRPGGGSGPGVTVARLGFPARADPRQRPPPAGEMIDCFLEGSYEQVAVGPCVTLPWCREREKPSAPLGDHELSRIR